MCIVFQTSILMAILGELPIREGHIKVKGQIAYAAQQPWVFSSTIRQNILFGSEYDEEKYASVINASALTRVRYLLSVYQYLAQHSNNLFTY